MLLAGLGVVAGDLAGLQLRGSSIPSVALLALGPSLALLALALRRGGPVGAGTGAGLLLLACTAAGAAAGLRSGRAAAAACLARVEAGAPLAVRGVAVRGVTRRELERARGSIRLDLRTAVVAGPGRRCRTPELVIRARRVEGSVVSGRPIEAWGTWHAWPARGVRPPVRRGFLRDATLRPVPGRLSRTAASEPTTSPAARIRTAAAGRLAGRLPPDVAAVGAALLTAERSAVDPDVSRRFADAGLAHLLAISGLHVGLLGGGLLWLLARVPSLAPRRYAGASTLVVAYVLVLGAPHAAVRAAVVFTGWCAARARGSPLRVTELVGAAAIVGVLLDPLAPVSAGWQLSFAGFGGLLVGGGLARRATEGRRIFRGAAARRRRKAVVVLVASAGAFLATAPFAAAHFGRAAPIAVIANGLGVPLVASALPALVAAILLPGALGELAGAGAGAVLRLLFGLVELLGRVPGGHGAVAPPGPGGWLGAALLFAAAVAAASGARAAKVAPLVAAALVAPWLAGTLAAAQGRGITLVCQLDVGQGDAAVVRTRGGRWIVLDAGPAGYGRDAGLAVVVPFLRDRGAARVELLALSHPHLDHVGGAESLLRELPVARLLDPGNVVASDPYARVLDLAAEEGVRWFPAEPGTKIRVDELELLVLGPTPAGGAASDADAARPPWRRPPRDPNEASLALRLRVGAFTYLNTGDAEAAQEYALLERWPPDSLRATLLKAGHHGSHTSSTPAWLAATRPRAVVVSAGRSNRYDHPHPEALERIRTLELDTLWRTDRDGRLCVEVDGEGRWRLEGEAAWRRP